MSLASRFGAAGRGVRAAFVELRGDDRALRRLVAGYAALQFALALWDVPGSYGWENDGVAPRDLFGGLAFNLKPGAAHRYPLLHYALVGLASLPAFAYALATSAALTPAALADRVLSVPVMTGVSLAAKALGVGAGALALLALGRVARRVSSAGAARWAVALAAINLSFAYYGRTSNVDVPALAWTALAFDRLLTVAERGTARDYGAFFLLAAASLATKDPAYASYVVAAPAYLVALPLARPGALAAGPAHWRRLRGGLALGALGYGVLSGGLLNPTGYVAHVRMLVGTNSQDWRLYPRTLAGLRANVIDLASGQADYWWPWPIVALAWAGVALALARPARPPLGVPAFRLMPLVAGVSSQLFFTLVVARNEHRFLLPLGFWLSLYGGVAFDALARGLRRSTPLGRWAPWALGAALVAGARAPVAFALTQWGDARREVEAFLSGLPEGTRVETYGLLTYLPRFGRPGEVPYRLRRVGPEPARRRNPLPGAEEVEDTLENAPARAPDVIVLPEAYALRFVEASPPAMTSKSGPNPATRAYVEAIIEGRLPGYDVRTFGPTLPPWAAALGLSPAAPHGGIGQRVWVCVRRAM
ncbi:MAG TPA: hypothetical protein VFS43_24290 [Polyangiaceae bacterium]|nr:hypothetical protein [Polyangiaceae bacterium]